VFVVLVVCCAPRSAVVTVVSAMSAEGDPFSSWGVCGQGPGCGVERRRDRCGPGSAASFSASIAARSVQVERTTATSIRDPAALTRSRFRKVSAEIGR
jgi:hypothetical protein